MPVGTCSPCVEFGMGTMAAGLCVHGGGCTGPFLEWFCSTGSDKQQKEEERSDGSMASSCA